MADRRKSFAWDHPVIITFLVIAVVASMSLAAEVLKPLALSVLLSFALAPLVRFWERRGLPRAAAVVLTVVLALGTLGGVVFVVGQQLTSLANKLPQYEENIQEKLRFLQPDKRSAISKVSTVASHVAENLDKPNLRPDIQEVKVVSQPDFRERLQSAVGPYIETLGVGSFVLILVLFMLMGREDLGDRIIQLFGHRRLTLTTRTMEEAGQRISRYLAMFAMVNSTFGLIVGIGLWAIGMPYAVLWGFLAAVLRFIPYIGAATAFALPLILSIAESPTGSWQPLEIVALFGVLEVIANSFLEPVIYGKTTGVSALGLLVAAMFWTWLWGGLGLLLSTPLTVCLAVLGKYVPSLGFFATLLGEEADLEKDVRYYQRLLALDQDGAVEVVDAALKQQPRADVFDQILIPALARAERDYARDELDDREQAFIWRVTGDLLDELGTTAGVDLQSLSQASDGAAKAAAIAASTGPAAPTIKVVGVAANDQSDALVLEMLADALAPTGIVLEIISEVSTPLKLAEAIADRKADLIVVSHLPPAGLTTARYLVKRFRARFESTPIVVGRWGEKGDTASVTERLKAVGATQVVFGVAEARDRIVAVVAPKVEVKDKPLAPSKA